MSEVSRKSLTRLLLVMLVCMTMTLAAVAQSTTAGAIGGTVTDQSKAIVPNAKVTIVNNGTNDTRTATADAEGKFRVINLQPGTYTVSVEAASFANHKSQGVVVEVGRVTELEILLGAGAKSETVEVVSEAPMINTVQQDFSHNINQTSINELPINGRRWSNFAMLTPGAAPDGAYGLISFRGISGLLNNSTVDGGDNNQAFFSEERGRTRISYVISQASVREFQVNTSNFSAEYGRAAGAVVNSVTKSGTNQFHGQAFYYIRDNELGATNPSTFQTVKQTDGTYLTTPLKPQDRRQQFGGALGGPLVKDKVFFFLSYDQQKRNYPGTAVAGSGTLFNLPTCNNLALGTACTQNGSSTNELATFKSRFAAGYFADDTAALAAYNKGIDFLAGLTGVVPRTGDQNIIFPKVDIKLNQNNTLALSYNRMRWFSPAGVQSQATVTRGKASWGDDLVKVDSFNARLSSAVRDNVSNEARFSFGRDFEAQMPQTPLDIEPTTSPFGLTPSTAVAGSSGITFGTPNFMTRFAYPDEGRTQVADTVSISHGKHLIKLGTDVSLVHEKLSNLFQENGVYSFSNRTDFIDDYTAWLNNTPNIRNYSSFALGTGPRTFMFSTWDMSYFVQDDWRVLPRLTLNAGMRYEYTVMPKPQLPNALVPQTQSFKHDYNNLGPRVGFAWDIFGDGKTAFRGGYGVYYGRVINSTLSNAITNTGATGTQINTSYVKTDAGAPQWPFTTTGGSGAVAAPSIVYLSPNLQNPRIQQVDAVFEREVARNTTLSVSYLGSFGSNLVIFVDRNLPTPTTVPVTLSGGGAYDGTYNMPVYLGARPDTKFGAKTEVLSTVGSTYHAMVAQVNRRMSNGLQFQSSFTWAHAIDDGQNSVTFTQAQSPLDPNNLAAEHGTSNFDMRKRFVASVVWSPQYFKHSSTFVKGMLDNWSISPIIQIASGRPFTEYVTGGMSASGCSNTVPTPAGKVPCATAGGPNGSGTNNPRLFFLGRNSFRYPYTQNIDLRASKRFDIHEGQKVEFLAEAFNLFNRRNLTQINDSIYGASATAANGVATYKMTATTSGGVSTFNTGSQWNNNTVFRERQIQFAVRYEF